ncbi:hypothetical protein [Frigoribacterium sp. RIT-PI-h]|uniref:hypothetical protein n=1 Tax=Frigoribacterium sp. RIT-PI-h TaxID=1690245 RepID=UPI00128F0DB0|nr:hypothetical protein [Frigoribacterium sp. RIT-PI-h]
MSDSAAADERLDAAAQLRRRILYLEGGFVRMSLGELREVVGAKRLGRFVLVEIGEWLEANELGFFPVSVLLDNSEPRQSQEIRVFDRTSKAPVAAVVDAVQFPTPKGDRLLREIDGRDVPRMIQQFQKDIWDLKVRLGSVLDTYEPTVLRGGESAAQ